MQILHAYMAEPYAPWSGLKRGSAAYQELKQQKAEVLWGLIEQVSNSWQLQTVISEHEPEGTSLLWGLDEQVGVVGSY